MNTVADGVDICDIEVDTTNLNQFNTIINQLLNNSDVEFRSQQRGDNDLTINEKRDLALQLLSANKNIFLLRFGKYLSKEQLALFEIYCNNSDRGVELKSTLNKLQKELDTNKMTKLKKNRRYQALQQMILDANYFSETEMMKRAPLLYNELVGQYLTEDERRLRDKIGENETLVQILMEGIERDDARELRKEQAEFEDNAMEEEDTSDEEDNGDSNISNGIKQNIIEEEDPQPGHSQWGEFKELDEKQINKEEFYASSRTVEIGKKQKALLKQEFESLMYQSFLNGKDDFDYASVDNNEQFDNLDLITQDEEDKYFDSEEANCMETENTQDHSGVSSEDELEIFMNRLQNSHPAVAQLSNDFNKLQH